MPSILSESEKFDMPYESVLTGLQSDESLKARILKGFQRLTERQKELLRLKFFEDYSYDEIAVICNISKRTAYNIVHDSLKILKKDFQKDKINISSFEFSLLLFNLLYFMERFEYLIHFLRKLCFFKKIVNYS